MKKKQILYVILLLIFVEQCTPINLIPSFVLNKEDYKNLHNVESDVFEVRNISLWDHENITYDTINNYFIVGVERVIKIDSLGNEIYKINPGQEEEIPYKTHFIVTDSTICDFSKRELKTEVFQKIINIPYGSKEEEMNVFKDYYKKANIVIYQYNNKVFFKTNNNWIYLKLNNHYMDVDNMNMTRMSFKGYPEKGNNLIFLKDVNKKVFSDTNSMYEDNLTIYTENEIKYKNETMDKVLFNYTEVSGNYGVTSVLGTGYYKIKKGGSNIRFKENILKFPFSFFNSRNYLSYYTIPEKFRKKTDVSFIKYGCISVEDDASMGIYVIKKK